VIYYNENGLSLGNKAFQVGFYKTTSTNIQTGQQRKLWPFSPIVSKRKQYLENCYGYTGERASEENFNKASLLQL